MWGEASESKREKGHLGKREEGENRGKQTPTQRWTETLHTWRDWERQREREYSGDKERSNEEAQRGEKRRKELGKECPKRDRSELVGK